MLWGDGFEIETVSTAASRRRGLRVDEVPSVERSRIHGESNLNAIRDGLRVLKTILEEKRTASRMAREVSEINRLSTARRRAIGVQQHANAEDAEDIA